MATGILQVNRDIILATKRQHIKERQKKTPMEAVLALAQMQSRPRSLLNTITDADRIFIIAQITRTEFYDPVTSALHCLVNGADSIAFFTDHSIYSEDLDDILMVARGTHEVAVISQNYILDEYSVVAARAADASGLLLYSSLVDQKKLRSIVGMAQRWKMFTLIQVNSAEEFEYACTLSPHALCFGDMLSSNVERTTAELMPVRERVPFYSKVLLSHTLTTVEDVEMALHARVDALIVSADLMKNEKTSRAVRELVTEAETGRRRVSY